MKHIVDHHKNIIEVVHVSFAYEGNTVLENVSLNVHLGDYLGVVGPNGGGKTTLLKIMLGLLQPQKGSVKLFGQEISKFKDWYKIGYVPQKATSFDPNFPATVFEIVSMGRFGKRGLFKFLTKKDKDIIQSSINEVGMSGFEKRLIGDLSGGQQQRIFIARALAGEPEVIFLDEPTTGVDQATEEQFYEMLRHLNEERNLTLVLVSHDIDVVSRETTEIACVNKNLPFHGTPEEFVKQKKLREVYGEHVKYIHKH